MERIRPTSSSTSSGESSSPLGSSRPAAANKPFGKMMGNGTPSLASKVLVLLLIIASVVFIANMTLQLLGKNNLGNAKVNNDRYQAVFLTNGQVYFGKLDDVNSGYVKLTDIYYLQVSQAADTNPDEEGIQPADDQQQQQISLAKLGKELHGPEDVMFISRDQVLFWENLKGSEDSQVTKAIEDFKAQGDQSE